MRHSKTRRHIVIPDTQIRPGVPTDHIAAAGRYVAEWRPEVVVVLGDWWDFPSLSTHKDASVAAKGYQEDVDAGNQALADFTKPIRKVRGYSPRLVLLGGNHDDYTAGAENVSGRPGRFISANPRLRSKILLSDLNFKSLGWEYHPFLRVVEIDGILYSHYFYAPNSGHPYGGTAVYKLGKIHHSFTQGHVQGLDVGRVELPGGRRLRGLVAGSFYQHDESYKGPQANNHWRGILVKHGVKDGDYDLMEVGIDYLLRKYS